MDKNQKNPNFIDKRYELVHKEMVLGYFLKKKHFSKALFLHVYKYCLDIKR